MLAESPEDSERESELMGRNQLAVVERGREPELKLEQLQGTITKEAWAEGVLEACRPLAELLDEATRSDLYRHALTEQTSKIRQPSLTPSARVLAVMQTQGIPFFRFAMNQSIAHKGYFDEHPMRGEQLAEHQATSEQSLARQQEIEAADKVDFDAFLKDYLALE